MNPEQMKTLIDRELEHERHMDLAIGSATSLFVNEYINADTYHTIFELAKNRCLAKVIYDTERMKQLNQ